MLSPQSNICTASPKHKNAPYQIIQVPGIQPHAWRGVDELEQALNVVSCLACCLRVHALDVLAGCVAING